MSPIKILFNKHDLIAVDKPAGLSVHGGKGVKTTILDILQQQLNTKLHLLHRLDQATSGVLLLTSNSALVPKLIKQLERGNKTYLAVVKGKFKVRQFLHSSDLTLKREKVQSSQTKFKVIKSFAKYSLVSAELITGRTHQIRKHLSEINHPILGDNKYGDFDLNHQLKQKWLKDFQKSLPLFLFAQQIVMPIPSTSHTNRKKKFKLIKAQIPEEFNSFLKLYNISSIP